MTDPTPAKDELRRDLRGILAVWVLVTVAITVLGLYVIPWLMPTVASHTMHLVVLSVIVFTVSSAPVAGLVYATAFHAWHRWRQPPTETPPPDGPAIRGNNLITGVWLVVSSLLCTFLIVWGLAALAADDAGAAKSTMTVDVTAQQWVWTFHYPHTTVTTPVLYLPLNRTVTFDVTSLDVTHGFWIVQMGVKIDANPGVVTTVSVTPSKLGTFDVRCSELCGLDHAFMVTTVKVVTPQEFKTWLASQAMGA